MPRRYTEEEAQRIFAHVAERQRTSARADHGLSLEDLQEAARAAGLDPDLVVQEAAALDVPSPERTDTFWGAPVEVVQQRSMPHPVSDETWAQIIAEARKTFGGVGIGGQIGRLREWTLVSGNGTKQNIQTRLALEPTPAGSRLSLSKSAREAVLGLSIGAAIQGALAVVFGVLFAAGVEPDLIIAAILMASMAVLLAGGTQIGMRIWTSMQERTFQSFLDRAELIVRSSAEGTEAAASGTLPSRPERLTDARLDLDALPDAPDATPSRSTDRLRT